MTQTEKETIEIFCREFTQAFYRISGNMIVINPDLLTRQIENDQHPDQEQILRGDQNDLQVNECSEEIDKISRLLPTSSDGQDLQVKKHERNSIKS
jgi:hypothetical protein